MNPRLRRIAVFAGAATLAGGAGIGVAAQDDSGGASTAPALTRPAQDGPGGPDLSALADALGVSESRLQAAIEATRPSGDPDSAPSGTPGSAPSGDPGSAPSGDPGSAPSGTPGGSDMAEALASELGLSEDMVRSALEATMPAGGATPQGGASPPAAAAPGGAASGDGSSGDGSSGGSASGSSA